MNITPSLEKLKELAADGRYTVAPLSCELLADFTTPIEALRVLQAVSDHCFLLESARADETWGRYTFLGFEPKRSISCVNGELTDGDTVIHTDDPSGYLRGVLADFRSPRFPELPPFAGGLMGYWSYDYLGYSEPVVRNLTEDTEGFRDVDVMLFDKVIAFDHVKQKIVLIACADLSDVETGYANAAAELKRMANLLRHGEKKTEPAGKLTGEITELFNREEYCRMVEKAKDYIREGDMFQIVLSNRLSAPFEGSLLNTYRVLRTINPSPYMFYLSGTDVEVFAYAGSFIALGCWEPLVSMLSGKGADKILNAQIGWQHAMFVIASLCFCMFIICFLMTREHIKSAP
ncbi:MAG: chorismate-binding protein, partial [Lachnospiraceae bacterium]|nr:chorismate-binding protein [Lachnospiraceae bacterium]